MDEKEAKIQALQAEIFRLLRDKERIELGARSQLEPLAQAVQQKLQELAVLETPEVVA